METTAINLKIPKHSLKDLAPQALPVSSPEVAVKQYLLSRVEEQRTRKKPEWDVARLAPAADLVTVQRELELTKQHLDEKREYAIQKQKDVDRQWTVLREQGQVLRNTFIHLNTFLKDNKEKQERAEKREKKDKIELIRKEDGIEQLKIKLDYLTEMKSKMEKYVNKYKIYEVFLENVCAEYKEFSTIFDVLNRYDTLTATSEEIIRHQAKDLLTLEECRNEIVAVTEEKINVMTGLNNEIAKLQKRFNKARLNTLHWEAVVSDVKNKTAIKALELEMVRTACWNMYQLICQRKQMCTTLSPDNIENQLICIKRTIQNVKNIERNAKIEAKKGIISVNAASSVSKNG